MRDQRDARQVDNGNEQGGAGDDGGDKPEHRADHLPAVLRRRRSHEREDADRRDHEDPLDDPDERIGRGVGQADEWRALVERERRGRDAEDGDEHDDGQQVALCGRLEGVGGHQLHDELHAGWHALGGALNRGGIDGCRPQDRLPFRGDGGTRQHEAADGKSERDRD